MNTNDINTAIERIVTVINFRSGSSYKTAAIIWSLWNGNHVIGLWDCLAGLDAETGTAVLTLIKARLTMGGNADPIIREILERSGEFDRYWEASDRTPDQVTPYPVPLVAPYRLRELAELFAKE